MSWTFRGIAFERILNGDNDPQWFPQAIARTVDVAAGDTSATPRRWVDQGAREHEPLAFTAATTSAVVRTNLIGAVGQIGTLTSPAGYSGQALLVRADPLARRGGSFFRLTLEFEFLS